MYVYTHSEYVYIYIYIHLNYICMKYKRHQEGWNPHQKLVNCKGRCVSEFQEVFGPNFHHSELK